MKLNGNGLKVLEPVKINGVNGINGNMHALNIWEEADMLGDEHHATNIETPLRDDAFELTDATKMAIIEDHFHQIMETLGLDMSDDSLKGTPHRIAKMFVKEIFHGLKPDNKPSISVFDNKFRYGQMLVEKNINLNTTCEHHFLPIFGKAHIAYVAKDKVIGLSKLNRIVDYFSRRPQVQERLTVQIANELKKVLNTEDVAVVIDAKHMCVASRGIMDQSSTTLTAEYSGIFLQEKTREELLTYIGMKI